MRLSGVLANCGGIRGWQGCLNIRFFQPSLLICISAGDLVQTRCNPLATWDDGLRLQSNDKDSITGLQLLFVPHKKKITKARSGPRDATAVA